jgi:acetyl esterase/lipase
MSLLLWNQADSARAIPYRVVNGTSLSLEVDLPDSPPDLAPVILYVHSWSGSSRQLKPYSTRLAREGVAGVRINYRRLSEGHSFNDAIGDVRGALDWLRGNAATYGFDLDRIGIAGASAGGFLASLVALENPDIRVFIGFNGGYDLVERDGGKWPPLPRMEALLGEPDSPAARKRWSPIHRIPESGSLPAFLLLHGTADTVITIDVARRFAGALEARGATARLVAFRGEEHGFFGAGKPAFESVYTKVLRHVRHCLLEPEGSPVVCEE